MKYSKVNNLTASLNLKNVQRTLPSEKKNRIDNYAWETDKMWQKYGKKKDLRV